MPRRRKKSSRSSRMPPLVFSESPLDLSRQFASPAVCAVNPVTADIVSLEDLPCTKWVSPQFNPTAPPSARRRRGRRRAEVVRTACSQNPNRKRDAVADLEFDGEGNRICDRRRLDFDVQDVLAEMSSLDLCDDRAGRDVEDPRSDSSDKENEKGGEDLIGYPADHSTVYGGGSGNSAMRLCTSLVKNFHSGISDHNSTPTRNPTKEDATHCQRSVECVSTPTCKSRLDGTPSGACGTPLGEINGLKGQSLRCPACEGTCIPLAGDTPINEYNLRVSVRSRRGRLPKAAWEQLIKDVS